MKKAITSLALCGIILSATAPAAFAAQVGDKLNTKGDITFEVSDKDETQVIVPNEKNEEPEVMVPDGGTSHTEGALRIEYVPDFRFGISNNLTAGEDKKAAQNVTYKNAAGDAGQEIPPFVQVRDHRGLKDIPEAKWDLAVSATPFVAKDGTGTVIDTITGAKINLLGSTLTMDYGLSSTANEMAKGQALTTAIPTDGSGSVIVLSTQTDKTTSGHKVSNVFENGYEKETDYTGKAAKGVEFYKPANKSPIVGATYESTLEWTLTDGY